MGSVGRKLTFGVRLLAWLAVTAVVLAAGPTPRRTHSFDIQAAGRVVCTDGATFVGETTAPSAVGILQTSELWDATGTVLLATGDSHTFAAVGETFTFTVLAPLTAGDTVVLSVTDVQGTLAGTEGDSATATVADCSLDICGDGNLDPGETCDPADPAAPAGCRPAGDPEECTYCGDGTQEASEECDDGNNVDGDGCDATCQLEAFCGDGTVDPGETCDPADPAAPANCRPQGDPEECTYCGDGTQEASEECDDGNNDSADGCEPDCTITEVPTLGPWGAVALALLLLALPLLAGRRALTTTEERISR